MSNVNPVTPSNTRSPAPSVIGTTCSRSSSIAPSDRYRLSVAAPPAIATRPSPAARLACASADSGPVGHERERRAAVHLERLPAMVGQHVHRRVIRRLGSPPSLPLEIPLSTPGPEHVAAHDVGARVDDPVDLVA